MSARLRWYKNWSEDLGDTVVQSMTPLQELIYRRMKDLANLSADRGTIDASEHDILATQLRCIATELFDEIPNVLAIAVRFKKMVKEDGNIYRFADWEELQAVKPSDTREAMRDRKRRQREREREQREDVPRDAETVTRDTVTVSRDNGTVTVTSRDGHTEKKRGEERREDTPPDPPLPDESFSFAGADLVGDAWADEMMRELREQFPTDRRGKVREARAAFRACIRGPDEMGEARRNLARYRLSAQWQEGIIFGFPRWLSEGLWRDGSTLARASPNGHRRMTQAEMNRAGTGKLVN